MKKINKVVSLSIFLLTLTSCGNSEESKAANNEVLSITSATISTLNKYVTFDIGGTSDYENLQFTFDDNNYYRASTISFGNSGPQVYFFLYDFEQSKFFCQDETSNKVFIETPSTVILRIRRGETSNKLASNPSSPFTLSLKKFQDCASMGSKIYNYAGHSLRQFIGTDPSQFYSSTFVTYNPTINKYTIASTSIDPTSGQEEDVGGINQTSYLITTSAIGDITSYEFSNLTKEENQSYTSFPSSYFVNKELTYTPITSTGFDIPDSFFYEDNYRNKIASLVLRKKASSSYFESYPIVVEVAKFEKFNKVVPSQTYAGSPISQMGDEWFITPGVRTFQASELKSMFQLFSSNSYDPYNNSIYSNYYNFDSITVTNGVNEVTTIDQSLVGQSLNVSLKYNNSNYTINLKVN